MKTNFLLGEIKLKRVPLDLICCHGGLGGAECLCAWLQKQTATSQQVD